MGLFRWLAPAFGRFGDRWSLEDVHAIAEWLRPALGDGGRLLDIGGGTGALAKRLIDSLGCTATVLDPTSEMLTYLPQHAGLEGVVGTAEAMPFMDGSYDAALISDAFHHFREQPGAAREIARVVRPGGSLLILELDPRGWMRLIVAGEKLLGEPGAFFTPEGMCRFMATQGIEGECEPIHGKAYRFLGTIQGHEDPDSSERSEPFSDALAR